MEGATHLSPAYMSVQECPLRVPEPRPQVTSADPFSCQRKVSPSPPPPSCTTSPPHTTTCSCLLSHCSVGERACTLNSPLERSTLLPLSFSSGLWSTIHAARLKGAGVGVVLSIFTGGGGNTLPDGKTD